MTDSKPSKSDRKRRQHELQELGESLIALDAGSLAGMPLDERLRRAIQDASRIRSRSALRRQKQLIGKLMREVDPEPIRAELARLTADDVRAKRLFARAERWRDRIASDGNTALDEFLAETGVTDTQLRQWLAELELCVNERTEKTIRRQIFRRIHEILGKIPQ